LTGGAGLPISQPGVEAGGLAPSEVPLSNLTAKPLAIPDIVMIVPRRFEDERGYFVETYNAQKFAEIGIHATFVQDNESLSASKGTVRGLHFQVPPRPQAKLVRVLSGSIMDVVVDIRRGSPTYGKWCSATLTASAGEQLYIPRGFAHGFCTLEADTQVAYKVDGYYAPECDTGILWNDPEIGIAWPVDAAAAILSQKDRGLPPLRDFASPFTL
jgi:dTDP-4-dehydrorhamnose 3,5-epimerase